MINGVNIRMLSHFTNKSAHEDVKPGTSTFDLQVKAIRVRRMKYLGHILWMDTQRLVYHAVKFIYYDTRSPGGGDLFLDVSQHNNYDHRINMVKDRQELIDWKSDIAVDAHQSQMEESSETIMHSERIPQAESSSQHP